MNRITQRFSELKAQQKSAFIPFITAGDPSLEQTEAIVLALDAAGADTVELGIPFSDPVGDGPTIQAASQRALECGVTPKDVLALIARIRTKCEVPLLLFSYFNPILAYGIEAFAADAAAAGADGVLCVDLPPEEARDYKRALDGQGLCTVFLTAPTTTDERLGLITRQCTGFVYYVSRLGVTGVQSALQSGLGEAVQRIKRHTGTPVAVGFGISQPEQAREVAAFADGVVVGSALVNLIGEIGDVPSLASQVGAMAAGLSEAVKSVSSR